MKAFQFISIYLCDSIPVFEFRSFKYFDSIWLHTPVTPLKQL